MPAIIYARLSKDDKTDRVESQITRCRAYCEANGIEILATLSEDDASASRFAQRARPKYREAIRLIEAGVADTIVAWNLDRLWRQPGELEQLLNLAEAGLTVLTLSGDYDLTHGDDLFRARILVTVAAKESDDKSRRTRARHEDIAAAGRFSGGRRPFGYTVDKESAGGLRLRADEANHIRGWVNSILAGVPIGQLVDDANARGIPTARGGPWTLPSLRGIVTSDRIAGIRTYRPTGDRFPAAWSPVISEDELSSVRRVLVQRGGRRNPEAWRQYLLSGGLAVCGTCGVGLISMRSSNGTPRYVCSKRAGGCGGVSVVAVPLEATVVRLAFRASERIVPAAAEVTDDYDPTEDLEMMQELVRLWASKQITRGEWEEGRKALQENIRLHEREQSVGVLAAYESADALSTAWPGLSHVERRLLLDAMLRAVRVMPATRKGPVWDARRVVPEWRA